MLTKFNRRWGQLIYQKRIKTGLTVIEVSQGLKVDGFVIRRAEKEPSLVPLCDLASLLIFYGMTPEEEFELCSVPFARVKSS